MLIATNSKDSYEMRQGDWRVRVYCNGEDILFAANDILFVCGIKAPRKWMSRHANAEDGVKSVKKLYTDMTSQGIRKFEMSFVNSSEGLRLTKQKPCTIDALKWLRQKVLACDCKTLLTNAIDDSIFDGKGSTKCKTAAFEEKKTDRAVFEVQILKKQLRGVQGYMQ